MYLHVFQVVCICLYQSSWQILQRKYRHDTNMIQSNHTETYKILTVCILYVSVCIWAGCICIYQHVLCMYLPISRVYLSVPAVFFSIMCVSLLVICICTMYLYLWVSILFIWLYHVCICMYCLVWCVLPTCPWSTLHTLQGRPPGQIPEHQSYLMPSLNRHCVSELPQRPRSFCPATAPQNLLAVIGRNMYLYLSVSIESPSTVTRAKVSLLIEPGNRRVAVEFLISPSRCRRSVRLAVPVSSLPLTACIRSGPGRLSEDP